MRMAPLCRHMWQLIYIYIYIYMCVCVCVCVVCVDIHIMDVMCFVVLYKQKTLLHIVTTATMTVGCTVYIPADV